MKWHGRTIYAGIAQGPALVSRSGISFFGGVDPDTGVIVERGHELEGQSIAGKVLVFPSGKGSTVGSYTLYRLAANGKAPAAIINQQCEPITAVGCIIGEIPCIDTLPIQEISSGQYLMVDATNGSVEQILLPGKPALALPDPLNGTDPGSFAYFTISKRFPKIVRQVMEDLPWPEQTQTQLEQLHDSFPNAQVGLLSDLSAPDEADWRRYLEPYQQQTWLQAPWFVIETYFFRRILAATGYFQDGPGRGVDPYRVQKDLGEQAVADGLYSFYALLENEPVNPSDRGAVAQSRLARLFRFILWGNQADLSLWPVGSANQPNRPAGEAHADHLLDDQSDLASRYLLSLSQPTTRIDFILDNVGVELAYDLALADFLLQAEYAHKIILHVKPHPTYVSDVTLEDVLHMLAYFQQLPGHILPGLAERLQAALENKSLVCETHPYWTSPLSGWEMAPQLWLELSRSDLLISKGDANYRRWLGDRQWPYTTSLQPVLGYLPAPLLALRVAKSNIMVGLPEGLPERTAAIDPQWEYNGAWGMIQFVGKPGRGNP